MKLFRLMVILLVLAILVPVTGIATILSGDMPTWWVTVIYQVTCMIYPAAILVILITIRNSPKG